MFSHFQLACNHIKTQNRIKYWKAEWNILKKVYSMSNWFIHCSFVLKRIARRLSVTKLLIQYDKNNLCHLTYRWFYVEHENLSMILRWTWNFFFDKWNSMFDILRMRSTKLLGGFYLNDGTENPKRATSPNYPPFSGFFTVWNIYSPGGSNIKTLGKVARKTADIPE